MANAATAMTYLLKLLPPNRAKREWLEATADRYHRGVEIALAAGWQLGSGNGFQIKAAVYGTLTEEVGLPSNYAAMAALQAGAMIRSFLRLRKVCAETHRRRPSFPTAPRARQIGVVNTIFEVREESRGWWLRLSTARGPGTQLRLPLARVPEARAARLRELAHGDSKLIERGGDWYLLLALRLPAVAETERPEHWVGVDRGLLNHAVAAGPDGRALFCAGGDARQRRERFHRVRQRFQRAGRSDRVRRSRGREQRWSRAVNHSVSRRLVDFAASYPRAGIALEALAGVRERTKITVGGRRRRECNRQVASWPFYQLQELVEYKAARLGIPVRYVDPAYSSQTCPRCGRITRANRRRKERMFQCVDCGYRVNDDLVAAREIAARGRRDHEAEPSAPSSAPANGARPRRKKGAGRRLQRSAR